jgi:fatty-acyl-CoA synthase
MATDQQALKEPKQPRDHGLRNTNTFIAPRDGLSHVSGDRSVPLLHKTIPALLADTVARYGPREAAVFVDQGRRFTWDELAEAVDALAAGLLKLGLDKGDRIGIWSPNRWEWLVTQYATARIGLILVNINPAYRLSELEYALNKVGCRALVTAVKFKTSDYLGMIRTLAPEIDAAEPGGLRAAKLPHLRIVIRMGEEKSPGMFNLEQVMAMGGPAERGRLDAITATLQPGDAINIQFTSGTTGAPKGATLTHDNIVNNGNNVTAAMKFTADDRLCIPVPFYHCFGMVMGSLGCVSKGATMVFPGEGFDPGATLKAVSQERCTGLYGVPTMFVAILGHPEFGNFDLTSLRTGIMAGAPCPIEVMNKVVSLMHMSEVTIAYGMTETSPVSFQSSTDDPFEKRVSTVGRIHPHVEVKIVDADGNMVPVGERGELCTRGYSVMKGYWDDAEKTREAVDAEGWMHTGDLATIDAEGYCNIVGRVKDMVIRGGENVYPREVEEFLYKHPKVKEVQVFGVPDEKYGEELCAWIVTLTGETITIEEIRAFCEGQIAHYKIPRYVRQQSELPMTVTGKPQKFLMREAMIDELGLVQAKTA